MAKVFRRVYKNGKPVRVPLSDKPVKDKRPSEWMKLLAKRHNTK
jgi:hypothetical protein